MNQRFNAVIISTMWMSVCSATVGFAFVGVAQKVAVVLCSTFFRLCDFEFLWNSGQRNIGPPSIPITQIIQYCIC